MGDAAPADGELSRVWGPEGEEVALGEPGDDMGMTEEWREEGRRVEEVAGRRLGCRVVQEERQSGVVVCLKADGGTLKR